MAKPKEKLVFFDEVEHKYTDKDGNRLISGTQLIHHFSNPFDPTGEITAKYAKKHGKTVEQVLAEWKVINEESCTYGTNVHAELEHYINTGEIRVSEHQHIVEQFAQMKFEGKLFSEVMVYSLEHMVAGTVDIIEKIGKDTVNIWDFKTNKELKKTDFWGNKMLHGLWYLDDCVAGDTKLITKEGIATIEESLDKETEIWNGQNWSLVKPFKTGDNRELHRITFSDGSFLDVTDNHKFLIKHRLDGDFNEMTTMEIKEMFERTKWLLRVPRSNIRYEGGIEVIESYDYGFILGDGTVDNKIVKAELHNNDKNINFMTTKSIKTYNRNGKEYNLIRFDVDSIFCSRLKYDKGLPKEIFTWNKKSILNFVAGWADADGCLTNSGGLRIYGREDKIRDLQLLLTKCGINSSCNLMQEKGVMTNLCERQNAVYYISISNTKSIPTQRFTNNKNEGTKKGKYQIIKSIVKLDGLHTTYCLTDKELNQCVFNNVLTKQCNFNHYQLQLSMYAYLCELKGLKVGKLTVLYIHPKKKIIEEHPVRYMKSEIEMMFEKKKEIIKY